MSRRPIDETCAGHGARGAGPGDRSQPAVVAARARALRTARVVTLGLALGAGAPGCTAAADLAGNLYCDVFTSTRFCCERTGYSYWDAATNTCHVRAVPGPLVAPPS